MMVLLKQGGQIRTLLLIAFPQASWKSLFAFEISIIIQPIIVNVIASLGESSAGSKKRKDLLLRADVWALRSVSIQKKRAETRQWSDCSWAED